MMFTNLVIFARTCPNLYVGECPNQLTATKSYFITFVKYSAARINFLLLLALGIGYASCTKEFVPVVEGGEKQVVVNAFINNVENMKVSITESLPLVRNASQRTTIQDLINAKVRILEDGQFLEELSYSKLPENTLGFF